MLEDPLINVYQFVIIGLATELLNELSNPSISIWMAFGHTHLLMLSCTVLMISGIDPVTSPVVSSM